MNAQELAWAIQEAIDSGKIKETADVAIIYAIDDGGTDGAGSISKIDIIEKLTVENEGGKFENSGGIVICTKLEYRVDDDG